MDIFETLLEDTENIEIHLKILASEFEQELYSNNKIHCVNRYKCDIHHKAYKNYTLYLYNS